MMRGHYQRANDETINTKPSVGHNSRYNLTPNPNYLLLVTMDYKHFARWLIRTLTLTSTLNLTRNLTLTLTLTAV